MFKNSETYLAATTPQSINNIKGTLKKVVPKYIFNQLTRMALKEL